MIWEFARRCGARVVFRGKEWCFVSREEPGWKTRVPLSIILNDLLDAEVREFNPRYAEAEGALLGQFRHLHTDIYGNPPTPTGYGGTGREFVDHLRDRGKFFDHEEKRERDLLLITKM